MPTQANTLATVSAAFNTDANNVAVTIKASQLASAWMTFVTNSRYDASFTPVTGVSATFTTPVATVTGTVHRYDRYSPTGTPTAFFRFVPNTDSAIANPSYDSFWSGFSANTLSGLLAQRGIF